MKPVIILENVVVRYRKPDERFGTFKEYVIQFVRRNVRYREFTALNQINLQVHEGEILGVVGRNGAGKSTLLKVISRVLIPVEGRVRIRGRVSPLLELGAGFHPELTGRENIFLNGALLGHSRREIRERLDEIVEFAELGAFIDSPLRTYSTGMIARLGFSIATTWKPDILILDEILAVGDENFRQKCGVRMNKFKDEGTTILLVSHTASNIESMCTRAVWLDHGEIKADGSTSEVIALYRNSSQN
ncbi:MAG: ABC transporter ATP-binding protein [Chloroflexota bacterium]|jgi:ABC-type polysaccharide/polyol phosphate transport system ATPase subunit